MDNQDDNDKKVDQQARCRAYLQKMKEARERGSNRSSEEAYAQVEEALREVRDLPLEDLFDPAYIHVPKELRRGFNTPLSKEAQEARMPLPPEFLIEADTSRIPEGPGKARAAKTVRNQNPGKPE